MADNATTESVERSLVAAPALLDEPPIESPDQPTQTAPEHTPEGEQPEAAPQPGEETGATDQPSDEEPTEDQAIGYDELLPAQQVKKGQKYPDELLSLAAKRWGYEADALDDPRYGQNLRSLLTDKINADIKIRDDQREREIREREAQAAPETQPPEQQEQPPAAQPYTFEAIQSMAHEVASSIVTDEGANVFAPRLYECMAAIANLRESENPDPKEVLKANRDFTESMSEFGLLLIAQTAPQFVADILRHKSTQEEILSPFIASQIEKREGTVDQEQLLYDQAYELLAKEPGYTDIAKYSGPGGVIEQAGDAYFDETKKEIADMQFFDSSGKELPPVQNAMQQVKFAIRYHRGLHYQAPDALVRQALEKGQQQERAAARKGELGSTLRPGRSSGRLVPQTTSADDEMAEMTNAFDRANPLSLETASNRT